MNTMRGTKCIVPMEGVTLSMENVKQGKWHLCGVINKCVKEFQYMNMGGRSKIASMLHAIPNLMDMILQHEL